MNRSQVDEVLTQFEATTGAICGIEAKADRITSYISAVEEEREIMTRQAETATECIDKITHSLNSKSEAGIIHFTDSLDRFTGLAERLERYLLYDSRFRNVPKDMQRELGPLLVPTVVLLIIVAANNCYFGFLLANDEEELQKKSDDTAPQGSELNVLKVFAIFHASLVGCAALYLILEGIRQSQISWRKLCCRKRNVAAASEDSHMEDVEPEAENPEWSYQTGSQGQSPCRSDQVEPEPGMKQSESSQTSQSTCKNGQRASSSNAKEPMSVSMPVSSMLRRLQERSQVLAHRVPSVLKEPATRTNLTTPT